MSDPNLDAWDRLCVEQDKEAIEEAAWWRENTDRVLAIMAAHVANGRHKELMASCKFTHEEVIKVILIDAFEMVDAVVSKGEMPE